MFGLGPAAPGMVFKGIRDSTRILPELDRRNPTQEYWKLVSRPYADDPETTPRRSGSLSKTPFASSLQKTFRLLRCCQAGSIPA